jgi:hypothetical protein
MGLSSIMTQLPSLHTGLADARRAPDAAGGREDAPVRDRAADDRAPDAQAALVARGDDAAQRLARRAALGPLTYGRHAVAADLPATAPLIGLRGAHLDVRG